MNDPTLSETVRAAADMLPAGRVRSAVTAIDTARYDLMDVAEDSNDENLQDVIGTLVAAADICLRASAHLREAVDDLYIYADVHDSIQATARPAPTLPTQPPAGPLIILKRHIVHPGATLSTQQIYDMTGEVLNRQVRDITQGSGVTPPLQSRPRPASERYISDYADNEPYTMPSILNDDPDVLFADTRLDLQLLINAVEAQANFVHNDKDIETALRHEDVHAVCGKALVDMYGKPIDGEPPQLHYALRIKVTGPPAVNKENGARYTPIVVTPYVMLGNITVPKVAVALLGMFPSDPSEDDMSNVRSQGYGSRAEVLRRVYFYNENPGVRQLPFPEA